MGIKYDRLIETYRQRGAPGLREAFAAKAVTPRDIDIGRLFCECFGWHEFTACRAREQTVYDVVERRAREATGATMSNAFFNISQQFVYTNVLDAYEMEEPVFTKLISEMPATNLNGEKIPGITEIGDEAAVRYENDPYAYAMVGENWVFSPPIVDRGFIVALTWEATFNDKTGQLEQRSKDVGKWLGVNVEKRAIDAVIDENTTRHRYNWRNAGQIATYGDNSGSHTWDNLVASNALVDHTDIDAAKQAYYAMTDPFTGEPINIEPIQLIAAKGLEQTILRVLSSTEIRTSIGGYATSGNLTQTTQANPFLNKFTPVTSRLLASRLATDTDWFLGNIGAAVVRMVAQPLRVVQAPAMNEDEFKRQIVAQWRANEFSEFFVREPRALLKNTVA